MEQLEQVYEGKAKKVFRTDDPALYIVEYKDDATAFNGLKKGTIAGKGVINNQMTNRLMAKMEKAGIPHSFKSNLLSLLPTFFTFHRVLLQAVSQSTDAIQQLGLMRVLLLSSYLLHRVGFSSSISLVDSIDLSFA